MEQTNNGTREIFEQHYDQYTCTHEECQIKGARNLARSFAQMPENIRIDSVRCMLLSLTSPPNEQNTLMTYSGQKRKQKRRSSESKYCTTRYAMRGKAICKSQFLAITQISPSTLSRDCIDVCSNDEFSRYEMNRDLFHKGKLGVNSLCVKAFLRRYATLNGLMCPKGNCSSSDDALTPLPPDTTKSQVYEE